MNNKILMLLVLAVLTLLIAACAQSSDTQTVGQPAIPPDKVVNTLYSEYLQTWPPRPFNEVAQLSPAFAESLSKKQQEGMFVIPFICAQDFPEKMEVQSISLEGDTAKVIVKSSFGNSIELTLKVMDGEWKIDQAVCQ